MNIAELVLSVDELDTPEKLDLAKRCYRAAGLHVEDFDNCFDWPFYGMGHFHLGYLHVPFAHHKVVSLETLARAVSPKVKTTHKLTLQILAQSPLLTNRQVADAMGLELDVVKDARRGHKVLHVMTPKDRGYAAKVLALPRSMPAAEVADRVGCSVFHVYKVRQANK